MGTPNLVENSQSEYVLQLIPYGVLLEDSNRKLLSVNNEFLHIFNITLSQNEMIGLDCELLTEEAKKRIKETISGTKGCLQKMN